MIWQCACGPIFALELSACASREMRNYNHPEVTGAGCEGEGAGVDGGEMRSDQGFSCFWRHLFDFQSYSYSAMFSSSRFPSKLGSLSRSSRLFWLSLKIAWSKDVRPKSSL